MNNRRLLPFIIVGVIALFIVAGISSSLFFTVQADERAVIFYKFGQGLDKENVLQHESPVERSVHLCRS